MLGDDEPCHRNGYLYRYRYRGLGCCDVSDLANLASLFGRSLGVPVRERMRGQRAQHQDERDRQHPSDYSLRHAPASLREAPPQEL